MANFDIKNIIKNLTPPILLRFFENKPQVKPIYPSYQEALKECSDMNGYEEDDIIEVVLEKTKRYKKELENNSCLNIDATTAYDVLALNQCFENTSEINVLDFGGACGMHYFTFKKLLDSRYKLNWAVVETPKMCKSAKELENAELRFFDNIEIAAKELGKIDLVFSSGTIQYVESPDKALHAIANLNAKYLYLTRLSLTKSNHEIIIIQRSMLSENGYGNLPEGFKDKLIEHPQTNIPERLFNEILLKNYKVFLKFNETTGVQFVNNEPIIGYGILAKYITN